MWEKGKKLEISEGRIWVCDSRWYLWAVQVPSDFENRVIYPGTLQLELKESDSKVYFLNRVYLHTKTFLQIPEMKLGDGVECRASDNFLKSFHPPLTKGLGDRPQVYIESCSGSD